MESKTKHHDINTPTPGGETPAEDAPAINLDIKELESLGNVIQMKSKVLSLQVRTFKTKE